MSVCHNHFQKEKNAIAVCTGVAIYILLRVCNYEPHCESESAVVPNEGAYLGKKSQPCCIREPIVNHSELGIVNCDSSSSGSGLHGCGFCHSFGVILRLKEMQTIVN
jgi:hypothetical protein